MTKNKQKAFMVYCEAVKGSNRVASLSLAAYKAYWEILFSMWLDGGSLPNEDAYLRACSRLEKREWKKAKVELFNAERPLLLVIDGRVTNPRLSEEWERTSELLARRSKSGSKGAAKRWQTHTFANGKAMQTETETETETETRNPKSAHSFVPLDETAVNREPGFDPEPGFLRFQVLAKREREERWSPEVERVWAKVVFSAEVQAAVFAGFERWLKSDQWRDDVHKNWDRWLKDLDFEKFPQARAGGNDDRTRNELRDWADGKAEADSGGAIDVQPSFSDLCEGG